MTKGLLQLGKNTLPFQGGLIMNQSTYNYYTGGSPLLNWLQTAGTVPHIGQVSGGVLLDGVTSFNLGYQNLSTGWLNSGAAINNVNSWADGFFTSPTNWGSSLYTGYNAGGGPGGTPWWQGQQWLISWLGTGVTSIVTASFANLGVGGSLVQTGPNSATITCGSGNSINLSFQLNITPGTNSPPTNITAILNKPSHIAALAAGNPWNPDYLADLSSVCGISRWMGAQATNTTAASDISQLADLNYFKLFQPFGGGGVFTGVISGGVLTVSGPSNGTNLKVGSVIQGPGIVPGTTITSFGTGTGLSGTYNVSLTTTAASAIMSAYAGLTVMNGQGPKSALHPSVICDFANRTNISPWFCFPVTCSDQMVTDVANYFKNNLKSGLVPIFEYGNEIWNPLFPSFYCAAQTTGPGQSAGGQAATVWGGFRASQIMANINSTYGNRSDWWGSLGGQCANPAATGGAVSGMNYYINNVSPFTKPTDLFNSIHIAPYYGPTTDSTVTISSVNGGSPVTTINTSTNHGYAVGQSKRIFIPSGTMSAVLNNKDFTIVSIPSANQFTINPGVDTTTMTASGTMYSANSAWFQIFDQSASLNVSNPVDYPTKYSYASQQMAQAIITGSTANGFILGSSNSLNGLLPLMQQNQVIANPLGFKLIQYEGGPQNIPGGFLNGVSANSQYSDFVNNMFFESGGNGTYTMPLAYKAQFDAQRACFSPYSSILSDLVIGTTWTTLRFFGDEGNAKWQSCLTENEIGQYVDPTPPATGTYSYKGGLTAGSTNPWTTSTIDIGPADPTRVVIVGVGFQGTSVNSITVNGVSLTKQCEGTNGSFRSSIWSGPVPTGSGAATIVVNSTSPSKQNIFVYTATNLSSQTPSSIANPPNPANGGSSNNVSELKGAMIVSCGFGSSTTPNYSASTTPPVVVDNSLQPSGAAFTAMFNTDVSQTSPLFSFSTPLWSYRNTLGGSCVYAVAVYR